MIPWIKSLFGKTHQRTTLSYELDKNREGLNHLIHLTERLDEMESDTQYRNAFLNAMANGLDFPMWVKGINGNFLFVNIACAETILRTTVEKALNLTDVDFREDALAPVCMKSDKRVQETLKTMRFIEHSRYENGRDVWLDTIKTPLIVAGKLIGIIGTAKDISTFVSKEIKDRCAKPGLIEIDLDLEYYTGTNGGKRKNDLKEILEKYKEEC
jgi:PAS domain-containing protein